MRIFTLSLVAVLALPAVACTQAVDSTDVRTSGVYADMAVVATGDGSSEVSVGLKVGGSNSNTLLEMKGEDNVTATANGTTKTLPGNASYNKTTFPVDAEDTKFVIAFNRGPEDTDAPNSSVTLPAPFTLAGITMGEEISRTAGFTATWDPSPAGDAMSWNLSGDCMFRTEKSTSDAGTITISASNFNMFSDHEQDTCNAKFCVERTRNGTLDPAFGDGGVIDATQQRCVAFSSAP